MRPRPVWIWLKMPVQARSKAVFSGFWMKPKQLWVCGSLRSWIHRPLIDKERIVQRQEVVQVFLDHFFERSDLTDSLKGVYDIERLASRVSFGKTNPKDLLQLATTLSSVPRIRAILEGMEQPALAYLIAQLDGIPELESLISAAIAPEAPHVITDGGIIQTGFDETLDKYRRVLREGTGWIAEIEAKERENSGISTLKIDYNKRMATISM